MLKSWNTLAIKNRTASMIASVLLLFLFNPFDQVLMLRRDLSGRNSSKDPILPTFKQWFPLVTTLGYCDLWKWESKISCIKTDCYEPHSIKLPADCIWRPPQVSLAFRAYFSARYKDLFFGVQCPRFRTILKMLTWMLEENAILGFHWRLQKWL